ncbi:poly-beta-1,6-N-acetyl-D-glucosamine biosynthesis protein PgaD [Alicyclobacillus sacchari]|uniref:Poly-beta-1,6-N-acetyl-D-glucosamine biosynthesis protein PgaD n=1 Tax=Alicyclobacillus sacchari TaxID=392010 RepID=A0A4R8LKA8_9BACL|nr:poly-beta-1,6-N-acetyl-D-glucosamine biosynthesis protein PgaD [Alicyclobacillus sacchari]TDY44581.1 poly-beta-1,6-N-acetyl-D-glucosamine biosynthesis protein PgaD [Alicyclobacillus sacchari]GMA57933.1 hypothetical protein GCM10025858_24360 [Alicyclobacillus sacchari]
MKDVRTHWNDMVINASPHRSKPRRFAETLLTLGGWLCVGSVLLQLLLALCLWVFGARHVTLDFMFGLSNASLLIFLRDAGVVGCASLCVFGTWVVYNKRRFGSLHRRKFPRDVTADELAERLGIDPPQIETWQHSAVVNWGIDSSTGYGSIAASPTGSLANKR